MRSLPLLRKRFAMRYQIDWSCKAPSRGHWGVMFLTDRARDIGQRVLLDEHLKVNGWSNCLSRWKPRMKPFISDWMNSVTDVKPPLRSKTLVTSSIDGHGSLPRYRADAQSRLKAL